MSTAGDLPDDAFGGDDSKKSERKRQRERQRRFDLANAFDELASILAQVDPDDPENASNRQRRRRKSGVEPADLDNADNTGTTRLDLIGRSVEALRRLHQENTELKRLVEQQREGREDKEVLVMVPTLTSVEPDHGPNYSAGPARSTSSYPPPPYYHQQHPLHHPQGPPPPLPPPSHSMGHPQNQPPPHDYRGYYSGPPPPVHGGYSYGHGGWGNGNGPPPMHLPPPQSLNQCNPPQHYDSGSPRGMHPASTRDHGL